MWCLMFWARDSFHGKSLELQQNADPGSSAVWGKTYNHTVRIWVSFQLYHRPIQSGHGFTFVFSSREFAFWYFQAPAVRWYALPRNDSNGEMHSLSCICSEILTKEEYWHKFGHLYQLWIFQGSEGRGRAWESQECPFSYFKIRKCMNETWVIESHGNGIKCWQKGTKYRVMEIIKNVTGQVIEFYKLRRIWIPRFCAHCFSFGKYYSPGRTWLGILKSLSYLLDLNLFLLLFC